MQLGLAYAGQGKAAQAYPLLQRAILAGGQYDHPMTSTVLLELGLLSLGQRDFTAATKYFDEATYAAVNYPDPGVLEEAFRYGAVTTWCPTRRGCIRRCCRLSVGRSART